MTISLTKIDFSFSIHSTEDFDKNMEAIANLIPEEIIEQTEIVVEELEGGYDNPIQYVLLNFNKTKDMDKILENIALKLSQEQKDHLNNDFEERFHSDGKTFFLRVNKEEIFNNKLVIATSENVIKVAIKMRAYTKDVNYIEFLKGKGIV
ncbi:MAG: RNA-binding domain-containing protein [Candidatus Heimdallarchaeaceae archaeon]